MGRPCAWPTLYLEINGNDDELKIRRRDFGGQKLYLRASAILFVKKMYFGRYYHKKIASIINQVNILLNQTAIKMLKSIKSNNLSIKQNVNIISNS